MCSAATLRKVQSTQARHKVLPTLSLVLPPVYELIKGIGPNSASKLNCVGEILCFLESTEIYYEGVLSARAAVYED